MEASEQIFSYVDGSRWHNPKWQHRVTVTDDQGLLLNGAAGEWHASMMM